MIVEPVSVMSAAREEDYEEAYDSPRVSWQTDALYHVEHARRQLAQARQRLRHALAQHERYEEEARQRAVAAKLAQDRRARNRELFERWAEENRIAAEKRNAALERWGSWEKRNRWIYGQQLQGRRLKDIAQEVDLSRERVRQICKKQERLNERAKRRAGMSRNSIFSRKTFCRLP